ncbi:unnamed protein product [Rhizoctonia solani]|uniref:Uncharacterized protein n=1 Tax=Rhizoctonia solani TaxID=456999 RepID=A0A8H3E674_9AGAM|nr:unnamed protein product [Rhizoctonia solani]
MKLQQHIIKRDPSSQANVNICPSDYHSLSQYIYTLCKPDHHTLNLCYHYPKHIFIDSIICCICILKLISFTTIVPTLASSPQEPSGLSARSSKIVGGVVGGTLALLGVLLALFYVSRRRRKAAAVWDAPRLQAPRQMLDADDFDLAEPGPAPYAYGMVGARANPNASGSIFHEALPGTSTHPSHSYSRSMVSENDPLLAHHMRGGSADIDSVVTSSPRESTHLRASSTTGLLYDPNDPFGDPPRPVGSSSSRSHPPAVTKALESRSRGPDQHIYPPSAYRGPVNSSEPLSTPPSVLVHQDAGRVDILDPSAPPAFQDPKSIRGLAKPFTHFDVPILTSEDKPNHTIGINDVGYLISPDSREFSLARNPDLIRKETSDVADTTSEEDAASSDPSTPTTLKSRYAVRIAISGLSEFPQPFFSHKIINPQEKPRIQRELATLKSAYEVLGPNVGSPSQSEVRPKLQAIEELLEENFNVPQNTLVLSQKNRPQTPIREDNNRSDHTEQPPQPTEHQLFKVHSRRSIRPVSGNPPPDSKIGAEIVAKNDSSAEGVSDASAASPMQSTPRLGAKQERQLEQMRRAAASQVRSVAEKRRVEEEAAKQSKAESEADHIPTVKQELSLWDRFLKR